VEARLRLLVCGGAGFIGSHLVDRLIGDGNDVVVLDDLSHGRAEHLRGALATGRCRLEQADITDERTIDRIVAAGPDLVVNLAAQIDVRVSVAEPLRDASTNVMGTVTVLEGARRAGARKVVLASSVAIFGPPQQLPVTEQTPTNPLSPYAVSKLAGEMYLRQYHLLHGLDTTTLVLTNTYGPRQDAGGEAGVVAIFASAMLAGQPTTIYGDGSNTRDYLYVDDAVDAIVRACAAGPAGGQLLIGTGVATRDLDLNRAVAAAVGGAPEPRFAPARKGDLPHMVVDAAAARAALVWRPRVPLAEGIGRTVDALRTSAPLTPPGAPAASMRASSR
jgi:UDP-glucose 4-epimerase